MLLRLNDQRSSTFGEEEDRPAFPSKNEGFAIQRSIQRIERPKFGEKFVPVPVDILLPDKGTQQTPRNQRDKRSVAEQENK
jgi:hypothetical protein